jgi:hypothetical protein
VPELGSLGSMRGAPRNERLYREQLSRSLILEVCLAPHGRAIHIGTSRTSRSLPDMSVHWGKAVKVTPRSK